MNNAEKLISVTPKYAIAGGEISINCSDFSADYDSGFRCMIGGKEAHITAASDRHILAIVPADIEETEVEIYLESSLKRTNSLTLTVGKLLAEDMHIVANPAVDPKDDSIILTRSGSRGQKLPVTLFRLEADGFLSEMRADLLNPTGLAFSRSGNLFVTNRSDGEVCRIKHDEEVVTYMTGLGIATGLAFDKDDNLLVGDRSGTIHKVTEFGKSQSFAVLEASVSAYHLAFGLDNKLYVTAPGLASYDGIYVIDETGYDQVYFRGFGRPQGLAFDKEGNLYVAASYQGTQGIVKISKDGSEAELFVSGRGIVGLCFTRKGEMVVATNEQVHSVPVGVYGTLLN
ncbi:MAG TPA: hypothetical protein PKY59_10120 [Pyrinomonadaceae bacterium]|nr:hypothetical protein [Pyrinomonadaceae bacterium]